jgi:hypothetical protein
MELEELKSIWKNSEPSFQPKGEEEIASMLKGKSISIIDKLKRSVWFELVFTVAVSIGLIVYAFAITSGAAKWLSISFILMCLAFTFVYVKKLILLNRFNPANETIRENLVSLIKSVTSYLNFYKRSYTVLYPVYFCLGLLFAGIERGADAFFENLMRPRTILFLSVFAGVLFFLSTKVANWYLKKLYGNHLEKLKTLLNDIHG